MNKVPKKLQIYLTIDFITNFLLVVEKDVILVICNMLSKMAYFIATTERMLAEGLARLFRNNIWKLYNLLENVISDRRPQFTVELIKELNRILVIKTKLSTIIT